MDEIISIEFTLEELMDVLMDFYGIEEEDFDINDYDYDQIKNALLNI